jgi:exoribonuclease R
VSLAADIGETLPAEPDRAALGAFLARRKEADAARFADLSLTVVKLLGAGEYILERRMDASRRDGHFGLGVADYTHSTAPNRRFADLVTQRLFKRVWSGGAADYTEQELADIARRCTEREDAARKVVRLVRKKAAAVFMRDRIGERFTAVVTGASPKGTYVRLLGPAVEGRVVRNERGLDVGDIVKVALVRADAERGYIDFEVAPSGQLARKLERMRRKRAAAEQLRARVGETFDGEVMASSPRGTYVRLLRAPGEGRIVRGHKGLTIRQRIRVRLLSVDAVHGFIDFERVDGIAAHKVERLQRKQKWARELGERIGERFDAVVTGTTPKATWIRLEASGIEGRLVRGHRGLQVGDAVPVLLLATESERGFIDFGRDSDD